jgi:glycosyl transferase family 87
MPIHLIVRRARRVLVLVVLCAAGMVYYHLGLFVPQAMEDRAARDVGNGYAFGADFYPIWFTSQQILTGHRDPYSPELTRQIQIGLFGRTTDGPIAAAPRDYRAFSYPAFVDLLFWPLALLPFSAVRIGLAVVLAGVTALSIVFWLRSFHLSAVPTVLAGLTLLTLSSYAVLEGLFAEQLGLLVGFLLAASFAALVRQRLIFSGSLLALTLIKPQMTALVTVYLLLWSFGQWRVRWRFAAAFLLMASLLAGSALLVFPHWISEWLQVVFGYRRYSTPALLCYLLGDQIGSLLCPFVIAALLLSVLTLAWRMRHASLGSTEFALTGSLLLAVTAITLLPGHAVYDHFILLPGILLIGFSWRSFLGSSRPLRVVLGVGTLALFWQWILAPVVIALRPVLSTRLFVSVVLTLPIRTAASIPFGVLALLGIMMWQVTHNKISGMEND